MEKSAQQMTILLLLSYTFKWEDIQIKKAITQRRQTEKTHKQIRHTHTQRHMNLRGDTNREDKELSQ